MKLDEGIAKYIHIGFWNRELKYVVVEYVDTSKVIE